MVWLTPIIFIVMKSAKPGSLTGKFWTPAMSIGLGVAPAPRVPSVHTKTVVYRDGVPLGDANVDTDGEALAAAG